MGKIRGMALEKCGLIWSPLERRNTLRRTWLRKSGPDYYGGLWREHAAGYASCLMSDMENMIAVLLNSIFFASFYCNINLRIRLDFFH